jgi:hypothetical protein
MRKPTLRYRLKFPIGPDEDRGCFPDPPGRDLRACFPDPPGKDDHGCFPASPPAPRTPPAVRPRRRPAG